MKRAWLELYGASIFIIDETNEVKVYNRKNISKMIKDFPDNKNILKLIA